MTCPHCTTSSGEYDKRKLCCAARFVEQATRDDAARLLAQTADRYGHDIDDLRNGIAHIRRERRKPSGEPAR